MAPTSNPERKLKKKIRLAGERGHTEKVEKFQQELNHFYKCMEAAEKNNQLKKKKSKIVSDDDAFKEAEEYNNLHQDDIVEKEKMDQLRKQAILEKEKRRIELSLKKKRKQEQEEENMGNLKVEYDNYKEQEALTNGRLNDHEAVMKVENYDELDKMYDKVKGEIKNKKLAKKTYKKQVKQKSMLIEFAIQGYMDQYNVSYEEAQGFIYNQLRKKDVPKPQRLMIDGTAKL